MSIPGIPGDRASYDVIYRARWDGTELTEGAAKARAELEALQKSNSDYNKQNAQDARDVAAAARLRSDAEKQLTNALRSQEAARIRLNLAENKGLATPEQYYQYRQRELEQQKLLNKARNNGRDTPDQVVSDIKNETTAIEDKGKKVSALAGFFEALATAQTHANNSDPFSQSKAAEANLKSYADQVRSVIQGLQSAVQNDPFANGASLKKASLNVQSFVDGIKNAINEVNNEVDNIGHSSKGHSSGSFFASFSKTTKDINSGLKNISENAKQAAKDGGKAASDLDVAWSKFKYTLSAVGTATRNIFGGNSGGIGGGFGGLFASGAAAGGSFLTVISSAVPALTSLWGIMAMGVTVLPLVLSGVLALATGFIGLAASIGTVALGFGAIIPIFVALAGAAVVLKEAVGPVVTAITALGTATNSTQVQAALKGLSPAAQAAALALSGLSKAFKGDVQQAFWEPLLPSLKNIRVIVKPLIGLLDGLGSALGNFLAKALSGFEKFSQTSGFKTLTSGAITSLNNLGSAIINIFDIVTKLAVAGQPITNFLTTGIDDLTTSLDRLITTAQNNGSLNKFFDSVLQRMMLIGNIVSNVFGGLHNLMSAFLPVGDAFLKEIDGWAKRFDAFSQNRKALTQWAKDAIPFLKTLGDMLANIVSGIVRLGSNPQNLKDLTAIFQGLSKIVNPLFNLIQALFDLFSRFATVAAPLIGSALSGFARAIQDVANWVRDIETHRLGIDALKSVLGIFGGLVVSASLVNFVGKLIALAGSSWGNVKKLFGFFGFGGSSGGGSGNGGGGPAQAAADTQLKAAQINLTASENNLRAAGIMDTAATENVAAGDEMGAAVAGGSAGGKSFGKGLLSFLGALGGVATLVYGNQAVNSGTAPNTGGRLLGEAGANITGGALIGGSMGGLYGAIAGGVIGGIKTIFDNGDYLKKLLNYYNPNVNAQKNLYNGPTTGYLTPKGTKVDPATGLPLGQFLDSGTIDITTVDPSLLGNLSSQYSSQVPHPQAPKATILPPVQIPKSEAHATVETYTNPNSMPGDPRANPGFGFGGPTGSDTGNGAPSEIKFSFGAIGNWFSRHLKRELANDKKWAVDAWQWFDRDVYRKVERFFVHDLLAWAKDSWKNAIDPAWQWFDRDVYRKVERFFVHDLLQWAKNAWHDAIDPAWQWFDRDVYSKVERFFVHDLLAWSKDIWHNVFDPAWQWFDRDVYQPVERFIMNSIPDFFSKTIPHWWDNAYGWFMRDIGSPIANFFSNTLPNAVQAGFKDAINWVIRNVLGSGSNPGGIIGLLNDVVGVVGIHIPGVPQLATGGKVPGPDYIDHDAVYAKLTPGEFVIRKKAAQALGPQMLEWLNHADSKMAHYAGGGAVGWLTGQNEFNAVVNGAKGVGHFFEGALRSGFDHLWNAAIGKLLGPLGNNTIPAGVANYIAHAVKQGADTFLGGKDGAFMSQVGAVASAAGSAAMALPAESFAASRLQNYGWALDQFPSLVKLWNQESGWNANAVNPTSGAYGIPQSLGHGHPYNLGDYQAQILWGLQYIKDTYGSPSAAWAHEQRYNWYNKGGFVMPDFGSGFAMPSPLRYSSPSPGRLSEAAKALGNSRSIGMNVETMNINNPIRETAGQSVQRELVKNRTLAGRGL